MVKAALVLEQARKEKGPVERVGDEGLWKMHQMYSLWGRKVLPKKELRKKLQKQGIQII